MFVINPSDISDMKSNPVPRTPRRQFIKSSSASMGALATVHLTSDLLAFSPNDKLTLGIIGPGGMGRNHIRNLNKRKDIEIAYLCDPDSRHLANAAKLVEAETGVNPKQVVDMREILENKSVDAVFIATPDHWHAPAAILAAEAIGLVGGHPRSKRRCSPALPGKLPDAFACAVADPNPRMGARYL